MRHEHWEVQSECPHCGNVQMVKVPVGERLVQVDCHHCPHNYTYTHVVHEHKTVTDET